MEIQVDGVEEFESQEPLGEYFMLRALDEDVARLFYDQVKGSIERGDLPGLTILPPRETQRDEAPIYEEIPKMVARLKIA